MQSKAYTATITQQSKTNHTKSKLCTFKSSLYINLNYHYLLCTLEERNLNLKNVT